MVYAAFTSAVRSLCRTPRLPSLSTVALVAGLILVSCFSPSSASAEEVLPHRPMLPGFGGLCDGGPLVCTRVDSFAFNARADAILLTSTDRRGMGFVAPYGFSIGLLERLEGGVYTHTEVWGQEPAPDGSSRRWQQGPMRFLAKGLLWPWVKDPHQRFTALLNFEYEARLPHFDGPNQLGLLTDLGVLRGVVNWPLGLAEVGMSAGALFDWQGRYGTVELGGRLGLHLPFLPDTKVFIEGVARGFASRINTDVPLPGAFDPARPIPSGGALGLGIVTRQSRAVDFAMVVHAGFGDVAPFFLTLRFADIAWGKGYPRPQSVVVDAVQEFAAWVQEQVASIDPTFNDYCNMIDDPPPKGTGKSMNLVGHRTQDAEHCVWSGLWLRKFKDGQKVKYWKNKRGTLLCYDEERNECFAERGSRDEPWVPIQNAAHTAVMRGDCIFEDAETKKRLTHFGRLSPDGRTCTDGTTTFRVGERAAYNPELRQIDQGTQGTGRQHPPLVYDSEPSTLQRFNTALGRGIEAGQQKNKQAEANEKAAAAAADEKINSVVKAAEEMTPATLVDGIEEATQEAVDRIKHAAANPKGTFNRALDRIKRGVQDTAEVSKEGIQNAAQAVDQGAQDALDWTEKPAIEQAEDVLKFGGEKAATAPREGTTNVATGMALGGAVKVLGGVVGDVRTAGKLEKAGESLSDGKKKRKALASAANAGEDVAEHTVPPRALPSAKPPHGNLVDDRPATLYEKADKDGNLLKHGVTRHDDPTKRYTKKQIGDGKVVPVERGPRREMLKKERERVETNPGPENREPWAGKRRPPQDGVQDE